MHINFMDVICNFYILPTHLNILFISSYMLTSSNKIMYLFIYIAQLSLLRTKL